MIWKKTRWLDWKEFQSMNQDREFFESCSNELEEKINRANQHLL